MYKIKNNLTPTVFRNSFTLNRKRKYTTRSSVSNFRKPLKKTKLSQFSISYRGPHLWNEKTTSESRNTKTLNIFNTISKTHSYFQKTKINILYKLTKN